MSGNAAVAKAPDLSTVTLDARNVVLAALIELGQFDAALELLARAYSEDGAFSFGFLLFPLSPGGFEFPDAFRKYPGYRELWSRPGLARLAAARIANGHTAGLPLNEDGTLVQF